VLPLTLRHRLDVSLQVRQAPLDDHHGVPLPPDSPFARSRQRALLRVWKIANKGVTLLIEWLTFFRVYWYQPRD
jgi:hypothetical protein